MTHVVYLHGFASSPATTKGQAVKRLLGALPRSYAVPRLDGGDFERMTFPRMRAVVADALAALPADGAPAVLIGSSLGGYLAALYAASLPRVRGLVLVAPAFAFGDSWARSFSMDDVARWRSAGSRPFFHHEHDEERPLGFAFYESCLPLPAYPEPPAMPVAIVHGRRDDVVDHRVSLRWAESAPSVELHLVDGDHRLGEPRHEELIAWCARDLIGRISAAPRG